RWRDMSSVAEAPSESCEELPAVTVPWPLFGSKYGLSASSPSSVVSGRLHSSRSQQTSWVPIFSPVFLSSTAFVTFMGAISPEKKNRLTVIAAVVTGSPAHIAESRATFCPCGPCGCPQPRTTSSISFGSSCGVLRRTSLMQCAAKSSGRVILKEPRKDLARAVRELATTTASLMLLLLSYSLGAREQRVQTRERPPHFQLYPMI